MRPHLRGHLVSVPEVPHKEPLLRELQDIQLGIFHDLHAVSFHKEFLYLEPFLHLSAAPHQMGDNPSKISRKILGGIQQHTEVRELSGQDMQTKRYEAL